MNAAPELTQALLTCAHKVTMNPDNTPQFFDRVEVEGRAFTVGVRFIDYEESCARYLDLARYQVVIRTATTEDHEEGGPVDRAIFQQEYAIDALGSPWDGRQPPPGWEKKRLVMDQTVGRADDGWARHYVTTKREDGRGVERFFRTAVWLVEEPFP